jgi:hypothetical protein
VAATRYRLGSELLAAARAATGYENNDHVDDDELTEQLKLAARHLLDLHLETFGPEPYRARQYVELLDGVDLYTLSQATYHVLNVLACKGTLTFGEGGYLTSPIKPYVKLPTFEEHERLTLVNRDYSGIRDLRYRLGGVPATDDVDDVDTIEVLPVPAIGTPAFLTIVYVPQPTLAEVGDETPDIQVFAPGGSSEWLIARLGAYIRTKEKDDPTRFLQIMAEVETRLQAAHSRKDTHEPARMRGRRYSPGRREDEAEDDWTRFV